MALNKEALTHTMEYDLAARNVNWTALDGVTTGVDLYSGYTAVGSIAPLSEVATVYRLLYIEFNSNPASSINRTSILVPADSNIQFQPVAYGSTLGQVRIHIDVDKVNLVSSSIAAINIINIRGIQKVL